MAILDPRRIFYFEKEEAHIPEALIERTHLHINQFNCTEHNQFKHRIETLKQLLVLSEEFPVALQEKIIQELKTTLDIVLDEQEDASTYQSRPSSAL
jgi:hypothetical protein